MLIGGRHRVAFGEASAHSGRVRVVQSRPVQAQRVASAVVSSRAIVSRARIEACSTWRGGCAGAASAGDMPPALTPRTRRLVLLRPSRRPTTPIGYAPDPVAAPRSRLPLAAVDLLDYPDLLARRIGREVLAGLPEAEPAAFARRSARARAVAGPLTGKLVELRAGRPPPATGRRRPDDRHPRRRGAHRRCAVGRGQSERDGPGAAGDGGRAVPRTLRRRLLLPARQPAPRLDRPAPRRGVAFGHSTEVSPSVERHLNVSSPIALSKAALEVLAIVGYRQ
jgi:hypothetical protein